MAIIDLSIEIPDEIELGEMHQLYFEVVSDAVKTFVAKNHDYCSSWRLYDSKSIVKELLVRCVRILRLLQLEEQGKGSMVAEGVEAEFRDSLNWCVFGALLRQGHGLDLLGMLSEMGISMPEVVESSFEPEIEQEEYQDIPLEDIEEAIQQIIEAQLQSDNPFPVALVYDKDNIISSQDSFAMGESTFHYIRSDIIYPDRIEEFEEAYPDKTVFIRRSNLHEVADPEQVLVSNQQVDVSEYMSVADMNKLMAQFK